MLTTADVKDLIETGIPGSQAQVSDLTGTSDHFAIRVRAAAFAGKNRIEQHKMVHHSLDEHPTTEIYAVDIKIEIPED